MTREGQTMLPKEALDYGSWIGDEVERAYDTWPDDMKGKDTWGVILGIAKSFCYQVIEKAYSTDKKIMSEEVIELMLQGLIPNLMDKTPLTPINFEGETWITEYEDDGMICYQCERYPSLHGHFYKDRDGEVVKRVFEDNNRFKVIDLNTFEILGDQYKDALQGIVEAACPLTLPYDPSKREKLFVDPHIPGYLVVTCLVNDVEDKVDIFKFFKESEPGSQCLIEIPKAEYAQAVVKYQKMTETQEKLGFQKKGE